MGTLQNVAVISSWQIMPVLGSSELFVVPPAPNACCRDCATTGEDAKSSAAINASFFISGISKVRSKRKTGAAFNPPNAPPCSLRLLVRRATVNGGAAY